MFLWNGWNRDGLPVTIPAIRDHPFPPQACSRRPFSAANSRFVGLSHYGCPMLAVSIHAIPARICTFQKMLIFAFQAQPEVVVRPASRITWSSTRIASKKNESAELLKGCTRHTFRGKKNGKDTICYHVAVLMLNLYFM